MGSFCAKTIETQGSSHAVTANASAISFPRGGTDIVVTQMSATNVPAYSGGLLDEPDGSVNNLKSQLDCANHVALEHQSFPLAADQLGRINFNFAVSPYFSNTSALYSTYRNRRTAYFSDHSPLEF